VNGEVYVLTISPELGSVRLQWSTSSELKEDTRISFWPEISPRSSRKETHVTR
jgi:hypothetical protein